MVNPFWLYLESKHSLLYCLLFEEQRSISLKFLVSYSRWKWDQYSFSDNSKHKRLVPQFTRNNKKCEAPSFTMNMAMVGFTELQYLFSWTSADPQGNQMGWIQYCTPSLVRVPLGSMNAGLQARGQGMARTAEIYNLLWLIWNAIPSTSIIQINKSQSMKICKPDFCLVHIQFYISKIPFCQHLGQWFLVQNFFNYLSEHIQITYFIIF